MRGMSRQAKSVIAFLAAIFCVVSMLVAWARFGGVFFLVVAPILGVAAFRLTRVGRVLWNASPDPGREARG